jgi:CheY-like chemotaxis protein
VQPSVNLEISHGDNLHDVMVDADQFWKVIVNLVKNAAESIKSSHGYIRISTYNYEITRANAIKFFSSHTLEPDRGVIFEVADNGPGIPQDIIDRLFEPFFSTKAVGRGLGLATVFGIVESHNGGVSIISHENIGTKFRVWLPAADEEDAEIVFMDDNLPETEGIDTMAIGAGTITLRSGTGRPLVLLIDDDASIIKTTSLLLKKLGVDTLEATSRTEALARFRKYRKRINLVMMDAQLGNLDSVRLLATLRMSRETLPVVICSGHSREKVEKMFENSKIDGILIKPYTMVELKEMLCRFIAILKE